MKKETTHAGNLLAQTSKPRKARYITLAWVLASGFGASLAACGGGGGGSSSTSTPPPPPPPPANIAPAASLSAEATVVEGLPFTLDASDSSDADGDTLTYSYSVISGPDIDLSGETGPTVTLDAPFVDMDTALTIQVSVSDGSASDTADATVTIINEVLGADAGLGLELRAETFPTRPIRDAFVTQDEGIVFFTESENGDSTDLFSVPLSDPTTFGTMREDFPDNRTGDEDFFVDYVSATSAIPVEAIILGDERVQFLDYAFAEDGTNSARRVLFDVADACALVTSREGETSAGQVMIIGRQTGLSFYSFEERSNTADGNRQILERSFTLLDSIEDGNPYCVLTAPQATTPEPRNQQFMAFNTEALTATTFSYTDDGLGNISLSEGETVSEFAGLPAGDLEFVAGDTNTGFINQLAVVLSDGNREGAHAVVNLRLDLAGSGAIESEVASWPIGTPSDIAFDFTEEAGRFLFVTLPDTSSVLSLPDNGFFTSGTAPFTPSYSEVGAGYDIIAGTPLETGSDTAETLNGSVVLVNSAAGTIGRFEVTTP